MASVVVTGASGFIGSALSKRLKKEGCDVIEMDSSDGDVSSLLTWEKIKSENISHVFHLAGKTYVPESWDNPYTFYKTNVLGTEAALEFCRKNNTPLTYISAYIYGAPQRLPISESDPANPNNPYAHSKYMGEELCQFYASCYGMNVSVLRPFNVFGVGQSEHFLIPSIIHQALYQEAIVVQDISPKRDYVYLSDLVDAMLATLAPTNGFNLFNIGSGVSYSVGEVIEIIQKYAETNKPVMNKGAVRTNEIPDVLADTSHAQDLLKWHCSVEFESGIKEIVRWEKSK